MHDGEKGGRIENRGMGRDVMNSSIDSDDECETVSVSGLRGTEDWNNETYEPQEVIPELNWFLKSA